MRSDPGFLTGFTLPLRAAGLLVRTPGLWPWAIAPLIVNVVLYVGVVALAVWLVGRWQVEVDWRFWGPVGGWLAAGINSAAGLGKWVVALPLVFAACYFSFTTVGMIVASPFNDALSERTERTVCGEGSGGSAVPGVPGIPGVPGAIGWVRSAAAVATALGDTVVLVAHQVFWSVIALPFLLVPVVGVVPLLLVNAWFTGRGMIDIASARNLLRRRHTRPILRARRSLVFGLGGATVLLFAVPLAGLLMLPIGVVAGTLAYCRIDWRTALAEADVDPPAGFDPPRVA